MKATGVVRRIDELGRIVIPKEIRKTLRIKEGESLEIYIDDKENILLKKYSLMNKIEDFAQDFTDSIYSFTKNNVLITDTDKVIAATGPLKKKYLGQSISKKLEKSIYRRESLIEKYEKEIEICPGETEVGTYVASSIIANGDPIGIVILLSQEEKVTDQDMKIVGIAAQFLAKHLED